MHLRRCTKRHGKKVYQYWKLVESYRTERGPRQRVVAYLGDLPETLAQGVKAAAQHGNEAARQYQPSLLEEDAAPEWAEVDLKRLRVEEGHEFGGPWIGLQVLHRLGLVEFLNTAMPRGAADIEWSMMALVLVLCRLCHPSSELAIAEHYYEKSGLAELLGIPTDKVNDDRLYRTLDRLLPHKAALEKHLKERLGQLFELRYDILMYDITSTYFEGEYKDNSQAQRGYSRDHRGDCKQVCIALVVSREGLPLGYEVFDGNRADVTTVEEMVKSIEKQYGKSERVWVMDRGMVSAQNLEFLQQEGRRYIVGTPRSELKRYEQQLLEDDWKEIRDGLEVKLCPSPEGKEVFILCRSRARRDKEAGIHARFEQRLEAELQHLAESCQKRRRQASVVERQIGRLLERNSRAAGLFQVKVTTGDDGGALVGWSKVEKWREWAQVSEGCYLLRSNVTTWSAEELWQAYIQLTQAETAFRIHKQDLSIRPIWHQRENRVQAHILVCFLAYVVWKTLGMLCARAGLGDEPRQVLRELADIRSVEIVLPTRSGVEIRRRYVTQPTPHQAILLHRLELQLPKTLKMNPIL